MRVIYTVRGLMNMDVIDEAAVTAKYGIPGRAYADFAALRGDPSDGLPGVPGVGEKTAAALIRTFGSIEGITTALDAGHGGFPRGSRDKLEKARDYLDVALSVVKVADDAPLPEVDGTLPAVPPDAARLQELGDRWGLGSSLGRFVTAVSPALASIIVTTDELYPAGRLAQVREAAGAAGLDAVLLTPGPDLRYVIGYDAKQLERLTCLAIPARASRRCSCRGWSWPRRRPPRPARSAWR